jgi:outer membrane receptor protein involved in Fe transport
MGKHDTSLGRLLFPGLLSAALWWPHPGAGAEPGQLDEVVVSAQKREQLAQDVPLSITAIGTDTPLRAQATSTS